VNDILSVISKMASAESTLLGSTFVAPVAGNDVVAACVCGMSYTFSIPKVEKPGWYEFKPRDSKKASVVGPADLAETEGYLKRLPSVRVVLSHKIKGIYHGVPLKSNSAGLPCTGLVPILLVDDMADDFDKVVCRYDGMNLWYDRVDASNDQSKGEYLRERYAKLSIPASLKFKGLTFEEKAAYSIRITMDKKAIEEHRTKSVKIDVEHAGGVFKGLKEKREHYEVTYEVDGQRYMSVISKDPARSVISAGICLSGGDRAFDLKSLITVMREGQHRGRIVRGHGDFGHWEH
jgi:hypothetical protein